ncbi:hypothetical protein VU10_06445, partial [Desulfobulbus sp. US1]|nr:hypothetical protein [Desulfobulbus sp. US1]
ALSSSGGYHWPSSQKCFGGGRVDRGKLQLPRLDRGNRNIAGLSEKIISRLRPGDIIMLHDLPAFQEEDSDLLYREFDCLFRMLAEKYMVIPLEEALQRPVMRPEKETGPPGTAC